MTKEIPTYTKSEQTANRISHGIGIIFGIVGLIFLVAKALKSGETWNVVSCLVFGLSMILLYTSSTLYHSLKGEKSVIFLRKMDHASIFLLIAGTYTPILVIAIEGTQSIVLLFTIWIMAVVGLTLKIVGKMQSRIFSVIYYLAMGWLCIIPGKQILEYLLDTSLAFIIAGGLSYTVGVAFYVWKRLPYNHAIWHLFVLGGSILHFFAIWFLL